METISVNQYEDVFELSNNIIVINYLEATIKQYMKNTCILYNNQESKYNDFKILYEKIKNNKHNDTLTVVLIPSYECNMSCIYCYEGATNNRIGNSLSYINNSGEFIKELMSKYNYKKININLLGGEPITEFNLNIIYNFFHSINECGVNINRIDCITNGLEVIQYYDRIKSLFNCNYQITLDGAEATHNKRRPARNRNVNSYKQVCESIDFLLKNQENVEIRINIDESNIDDIGKIINMVFKNNWYKYIGRTLSLYAYPISENGVCNNVCYSSEKIILEKILNYLKCLKKYRRIISVRAHGIDFIDAILHGKPIYPIINFCGATNGQIVFAPNGYVYPCWWGHNRTEDIIGSYKNQVTFNRSRYELWNNKDIYTIEECKKCKYAFICGGGCSYKALKKNKTLYSGNCPEIYDIFKTYLQYKLDP